MEIKRSPSMPTRRDRALVALKASDRKIARLIDRSEPIDLKAWRKARAAGDAFSVLVYSIIAQQLSGFAVRAIAGRLREPFGGLMPSPAEPPSLPPPPLQTIGISRIISEYFP